MWTKLKKYVFPRYEVEHFVSMISRRSFAPGVLKFEIFKGASYSNIILHNQFDGFESMKKNTFLFKNSAIPKYWYSYYALTLPSFT